MALKDSKREQIIADLQPVLMDGETLIDVTTGMAEVTRLGRKTERRGTLFVTDRRVGLFTKKIGGHDMLDFSYGLLTSIEYKKGLSFGEITLLAAGDRTRFHMIPKNLVEEFVKVIRERMAVSHHHNQPPAQVAPPASIADELTKLASLRNDGVLTQEEFEAQKAKLIG
jgi:L-ascorbate metabolism protein UlaG (beta-lactamase superfamily)